MSNAVNHNTFFVVVVHRKARRKDRELSSLCSDDPKLYLEEGLLERKCPDIDLQVLLDLPPGLDYNEWLASHSKSMFFALYLIPHSNFKFFNAQIQSSLSALAFFDHINLIYGTISEFCTMSGCPEMTGPGLRFVFHFMFIKTLPACSTILKLLFHNFVCSILFTELTYGLMKKAKKHVLLLPSILIM